MTYHFLDGFWLIGVQLLLWTLLQPKLSVLWGCLCSFLDALRFAFAPKPFLLPRRPLDHRLGVVLERLVIPSWSRSSFQIGGDRRKIDAHFIGSWWRTGHFQTRLVDYLVRIDGLPKYIIVHLLLVPLEYCDWNYGRTTSFDLGIFNGFLGHAPACFIALRELFGSFPSKMRLSL